MLEMAAKAMQALEKMLQSDSLLTESAGIIHVGDAAVWCLRLRMAWTLPQPLLAMALATARAAVFDMELQSTPVLSMPSYVHDNA